MFGLLVLGVTATVKVAAAIGAAITATSVAAVISNKNRTVNGTTPIYGAAEKMIQYDKSHTGPVEKSDRMKILEDGFYIGWEARERDLKK